MEPRLPILGLTSRVFGEYPMFSCWTTQRVKIGKLRKVKKANRIVSDLSILK